MSSDSTVNEISELLGSLREHAQYLGELGAETVERFESRIDESSIASVSMSVVTGSPDYKAAAAESPKRTTLPDDFSTTGTRAAAIKSAPQDTLFGDLRPHEPSLIQSSETLEVMWRDIGDCTRCGLCEGRTQVVNTYGNPKARLMFVGEAPGADEDAQGLPFVGRAGQLLTKIIEAIGMKRTDVYICNILKCRPPNNRRPTPNESEQCTPYLNKQIELLNPKFIICLGLTSA